MTGPLPRFYVENIKSIQPNPQTGIVKLTFGVSNGAEKEAVVQLIVSAPILQEIFGEVSERMRKTFGGPGRRMGGGGPGAGPAARDAGLPDVTGD